MYHTCCLSIVCLIFKRAAVGVLGPPGVRAAPQGVGTSRWRGVALGLEAAWPCQGRG